MTMYRGEARNSGRDERTGRRRRVRAGMSTKTLATGLLLLIVLCAILTFAAFAIFPDFFTKLAETMRQAAHPAPVGEVIPVA